MALTKIFAYPILAPAFQVGVGALSGLAVQTAAFKPSASKTTHNDGQNFRAATVFTNPEFNATIEATVIKAGTEGWAGALESRQVGSTLPISTLSSVFDVGDNDNHGSADFVAALGAPVWVLEDVDRKKTKGDLDSITLKFEIIDAGAD